MNATIVTSIEELEQIIVLQKKNLKQNITAEEKSTEGFVTMEFSLPMLQELHSLAPDIIIKDGDQVVAYAIVLLQEGRKAYPALEPMFRHFEKLKWKGKPLYDYKFYAMGQICIDKAYRGKGLFNKLYDKHREIYKDQYDFIITEVSTGNARSLNAHERVGFKIIDTFRDEKDEWAVVIWDWQ